MQDKTEQKPKLRHIFESLLFVTRSILTLIWLGLSWLLYWIRRLFGFKFPWPNRFFYGGIAWFSGVRVERVGVPVESEHLLLIANHVSWMDIVVLGAGMNCTFVSNVRLANDKVLGSVARATKTVFVATGDRLGVVDQIANLRTAVFGRHPVVIFPEGVVGNGRQLLEFKPSLLSAIEDAPDSLLVQPVALVYDTVGCDLAWVGGNRRETRAANMKRVFKNWRPIRVQIHFLPPFTPSSCGNRKAIAQRAWDDIATVLKQSEDGLEG